MKILKSIGICIVVLVVSYFLSIYFGELYNIILSKGIYTSMPASAFLSFAGLPLAYIFFLTFLFTAFGGGKKYWWIGILLIPAAWFEIYFDLSHLYFPFALALLGWLLGLGIRKLLFKKKPN